MAKLLNPYLCESTKDLCRWRKRMKKELLIDCFDVKISNKMRSAIKKIDEVLLERIIKENS